MTLDSTQDESGKLYVTRVTAQVLKIPEALSQTSAVHIPGSRPQTLGRCTAGAEPGLRRTQGSAADAPAGREPSGEATARPGEAGVLKRWQVQKL